MAFLEALRNPGCTVDMLRQIPPRVPGDWRTQPRRPGQVSEVHYLFCAPAAALRVRLQRGSLIAPPQTLCWFTPGVAYELELDSAAAAEVLIRFRFRVHDGHEQFSPSADPLFLPRADWIPDACYRCRGDATRDDGWGRYRLRCQLGLIAAEALEQHGGGAQETTGLSQRQRDRLDGWLLDNLHRRPDPSELAAVLGLSPGYAARLVKRSLGVPPRRWLVQRRIQFAADRLLESRGPIAAVAREFGYDNPFLFSRQFRDVLGMSPRAYRRRYG